MGRETMAIIEGPVIRLGENIDTDLLFPGKYLHIFDAKEMAQHALEGVDPAYPEKIGGRGIIVAGRNFGCGSSREQAATCLASVGIKAIVAPSFARIFFRNAINQGIILVQVAEELAVEDGDSITIDLDSSLIKYDRKEVSFTPLPEFLLEIVESGGLVEYTRRMLEG